MIKLFIIDDHYLIIEGLCTTFDLDSDDFEVVGGSLSIEDALAKIIPGNVDIILLDLFLQNTDPVNNLTRLQTSFPDKPVVILSHESCITWQVEMFRHGVKAYIDKGEDQSNMIHKLTSVYAGEVVIPDAVATVILSSIDNMTCSQYFTDFNEIITDLSKGMTIKEIAAKMGHSESLVEKKLQSLRKCYQAKTNTELVYKALIKSWSN